jgi:hypothetical protein
MFGSLGRPRSVSSPFGAKSVAREDRPWPERLLVVLVGAAALIIVAGCSITVGGATSTSNNPMTVSLKIVRGAENATLAIAPVTINGKGPYDFIVDTGASISLIDKGLAQRLGLPHTGGRQPVSGVGGTQEIVFVDVSRWKVGQLTLPRTSIGSGTLPTVRGESGFQGLLGSDIWSQFGKITIDYGAATLTVYKTIAARPGMRTATTHAPDGAMPRPAA